MKFNWKNKRPRIDKAIFSRMSEAGESHSTRISTIIQSNINKNIMVLAPKHTGRSMIQNRGHRDKPT